MANVRGAKAHYDKAQRGPNKHRSPLQNSARLVKKKGFEPVGSVYGDLAGEKRDVLFLSGVSNRAASIRKSARIGLIQPNPQGNQSDSKGWEPVGLDRSGFYPQNLPVSTQALEN